MTLYDALTIGFLLAVIIGCEIAHRAGDRAAEAKYEPPTSTREERPEGAQAPPAPVDLDALLEGTGVCRAMMGEGGPRH